MTEPPLDPLPPDVLALLDVERPGLEVSASRQERARRRLETSLAIGGAGALGAAAVTTGMGKTKRSALMRLATNRATGIVVAGALGMGAGAALHARIAKQEPRRVVYVDRAPTAAVVPEIPPSEPSLSEPSAQPPVVRSTPAVSTEPPRAAAPAETSLSSERLLLEAARTALARGDGTSALDALDRHLGKYPHGQLAEEREALAVQALVASGRGTEAKSRAVRFHARFPSSMFTGAVDAAILRGPVTEVGGSS